MISEVHHEPFYASDCSNAICNCDVQNLDCSARLIPGTFTTIRGGTEECQTGLTVQPGDTLMKWCDVAFGPGLDGIVCLSILNQLGINTNLEASPPGSMVRVLINPASNAGPLPSATF